MLPYKAFLTATDRTHSQNALSEFEAYTRAFRDHHARKFFERHKHEAWIVERYQPTEMERRFAVARKLKEHRCYSAPVPRL